MEMMYDGMWGGWDLEERLTKQLEITGGHDKDHSGLFRLPPIIIARIDDGEYITLDEW